MCGLKLGVQFDLTDLAANGSLVKRLQLGRMRCSAMGADRNGRKPDGTTIPGGGNADLRNSDSENLGDSLGAEAAPHFGDTILIHSETFKFFDFAGKGIARVKDGLWEVDGWHHGRGAIRDVGWSGGALE